MSRNQKSTTKSPSLSNSGVGILLASLYCFISAVSAVDSYPLGISLGPTYITAAQFTAKQHPVPVVHITGHGAYQAYLADTLASEGTRIQKFAEWYIREGDSLVPAPPDTHDSDRAQAIFVDALATIKEAASKAMHHSVQIATVSAPQHFNSSSMDVVIRAAMEVEPTIRQPWQVIKSANAMRLAYRLDTCEGFGMDSESCDIEEGPHLILIVEYQETYLEISLADVTAATCNINGHARFNNLGENALLNAASHANANWIGRIQDFLHNDISPVATIHKDKHYTEIQNTLRNLMADHKLGAEHPENWEFFRAVILSGDASESAFQTLRLYIAGALGEHETKIRDSINPLYVGALGAGQRGRHQVLNPKLLDDIPLTNFVPEHDEL